MLGMFVCVISIPITQVQIYWTHIIGTLLFRCLTWWDVSPPTDSNDMLWSGGASVQPSTQEENWMQVNQSTPICYVTDLPSVCTILRLIWFFFYIPSRLWYVLHISMSSIGICVLMSVFSIVVCVGLWKSGSKLKAKIMSVLVISSNLISWPGM